VSNLAVQSAGSRVEKFAPTGSRWLGCVIIVGAVAIAAFAVAHDLSRDVRGLYIAVAVALLSWVVLIRPVVSANDHGVLLRNMLRDVFVPWSKITNCRIFQTLQVVTEEDRFHGLGLGRSTRKLVQRNFGRSSLVTGWLAPTMQGSGATAPSPVRGLSGDLPRQEVGPGAAYQDYVESRISDLAQQAPPDDLEPVVSWVWQSIVCVAAVVVLLVLVFA
jgi:Bacterial PH domain